MNIPVVKVPTFTMTLPVSGETINFRPFLVKEEKLLLLAKETETIGASIGAIVDIVENCTFDKMKVDEKKEDKFGKTEPNKGNLDYWIVKLTKTGQVEWQKTLGGIYADELKSIEQTKDGGYIVGGYSNSPISEDKINDSFGEGDFWIVKLNGKGTLEWQKTYGGADTSYDYFENLKQNIKSKTKSNVPLNKKIILI